MAHVEKLDFYLDENWNEAGTSRHSRIGSFRREIHPGEAFAVNFPRDDHLARLAVQVYQFQHFNRTYIPFTMCN